MRVPSQVGASVQATDALGVLANARNDLQSGGGIQPSQQCDPTACAGLTGMALQLCLAGNGCLGARSDS